MAEDINDYFTTFEQYSECVKKALTDTVHDSKMGSEDKVDVIYATPPLAFAKYKNKIVNGTNPGPTVSFYLSAIDISEGEQMLGWPSVTIDDRYSFRAPVICKLTYTITMICTNESQADLLSAQVLMAMPFMRPYATKLDGQWVTMIASNPENLSSVESDETEKVAKRQLTVEIQRAYLNFDIGDLGKHTINEINLHMYTFYGDFTINSVSKNDPFGNRTKSVDITQNANKKIYESDIIDDDDFDYDSAAKKTISRK